MNVLDLFSGIGGFSLGLERAGMRTVMFCEIDPYCQAVLRKHWPNVPCYTDVHHLPHIDAELIVGGPPCQATSVAAAIWGKRTGSTLWAPMRDVIERCQPKWTVIEQPPGNGKWEKKVEDDLAQLGYHSAKLKRSARDCGAPHERRRVFIVANALRERCETVAWLTDPSAIDATTWAPFARGTWRETRTGNNRMDDGFPDWVDRLRTLGNAIVPQIAEIIGRAIMSVETSLQRNVVT
jgi:DNA (cytosine-5)-methyltransferase 1